MLQPIAGARGNARWWLLGFAVVGLLAAVGVTVATRHDGGATRSSGALPPPNPSAGPAAEAPPPVPARSAPPPSPAELALVAPLVPGANLAGFTIRHVRAVDQGRMRIVAARGDAEVRLDVALVDPEEPVSPPAKAGRYAIFYSLRGATPADGERLAQKLSAILTANQAAPPPPGMAVWSPGPKPGTTL